MKIISRISAVLLCLVTMAGCGNQKHLTEKAGDDIIVVYENDVHCGVDGYAAFKALKDEMKASHSFVTTVSCGDFVQGGSLGAASRGRYIVDIMNEVGYDLVTLGNHEFDYGIPRQQELMEALTAKCVCCNLIDLRTGKQVYKPYEIVDYDGFKVAFVGMSTPYTINASTPAYFKDEDGRYIYSFSGDNFCEVVQESVNAAKKEGADFVVALSHLGDKREGEGLINSIDMVNGTYGIDVVLDAHSHTIMPSRVEKNAKGKDVVLSSTGTKFQRMGILTIRPDGKFTTELVETASWPKRDAWVEKFVQGIKDGYKKIADRVVFTSDVRLESYDSNGNRLVRKQESNLGNFCADAYRTVLNADIGMLGGGSIRADLPKGDVTFNDVYTMFPFENGVCKATLTGALLLDVLEYSVSAAPGEFGGFQQVSGIRFEYDTTIPSPVKVDTKHNFVGIEGERRVKKVEIYDREKGAYLPLVPEREYTVASSSYLVKAYGDGFTMMERCISIEDSGMIDTDVIQSYVDNCKGHHVGGEYAATEGRIKAY